MCVFLLEARWWGLVCDGGQQWPQTLNREASVPLHPSDTHTHTDSHSTVCIPLRPSETAQHLLCKSHTHIARVHSEVLNRVRQWTSVTPRPLHLWGALRCQRHKRGHPVLRNRLASLDFGGSFLFSSLFAPHLPQISEDESASLSGSDPLRQG